MSKLSALLLGATGLVGSHALELLIRDDRFSRIVVPTRRPLPANARSSKVESRIVDFEHPESLGDLTGIQAGLCALGTTIKKAGSKENFRKVDYGYCMESARRLRSAGASKFAVVTSMGTSPNSPLFYSRVKGELESDLQSLSFDYLGLFRPSFLDGERQEHRPGEAFAMKFGWLMPKKYKPIHARVVASAMIDALAEDRSGRKIVESDQLQDYARLHGTD